MFWWFYQSKRKKVLYSGALIMFAAGVSTRGLGTIIGILGFVIFFLLAVILPDKPATTPEEVRWNYLISPHYPKKERKMATFLNIVCAAVSVVTLYFLFDGILTENYVIVTLCVLVILLLFSSWLSLNPRFYNSVYLTKKIIPLKKETTTNDFYKRVGDIPTPYGTALLGLVPNVKQPVAVYRIVDLLWIVYYYVKNNEIRIFAECLDSEKTNADDAVLIYKFTQELTDLFCYIENTDELPKTIDVAKIFEEEGNDVKKP